MYFYEDCPDVRLYLINSFVVNVESEYMSPVMKIVVYLDISFIFLVSKLIGNNNV